MGLQSGVSETGRVDVGGAQLTYDVRGTGRPVVLVHGALLGRRLWDPILGPFSRRYRVFRFDQRGYGDSDRPARRYSYVEDLRRLADAWNLSKAVYIGFDEGAATVLDFALASPERVDALVLISPYLHGYDYSPAFVGNLQKMADAYLTGGGPAIADAVAHDAHYSPTAGQPDARKRLRELILENAHVLALNPMLRSALEPLAAGRLEQIQAPTLILVGDHDNVDNLTVSDRLRFGIPGARFHPIPGGHVLPVETPAAVVESVADFLNDFPAAP